jgi:uncharacterized protein (DUF736 family)
MVACLPGSPLIILCQIERTERPLQWADLAEGRLRLDRLCRNGADRLSSPGLRPFLAKQQSRSHAILRWRCGRKRCGVDRLRPIDRHRGRNGAGSEQRSRRIPMATIGTFKKTGNEFTGQIVTLSLQAKNVRIVPETSRSGENAPSHRVYVGRVEIGAAWSKRSNEGRDYLGLKLDDPSFNAPIFANLFDDEDGEGFSLIWSRPSRRNGD